MSATSRDPRAQVETRLAQMVAKDDQFREELKADPAGALAKVFGTRLPENLNFQVHEEDPDTVHIVIPGKPQLPEDAAARPHSWCPHSDHSWSSCGYNLTCYGPTCDSD